MIHESNQIPAAKECRDIVRNQPMTLGMINMRVRITYGNSIFGASNSANESTTAPPCFPFGCVWSKNKKQFGRRDAPEDVDL